MKMNDIIKICRSYPHVTSDFPFGDQPECYRIGGRIFAELYPAGVRGAMSLLLKDPSVSPDYMVPMITLRCEPLYGDNLRLSHPDAVFRPYHCPLRQQPYSITIRTDTDLPEAVIEQAVDHSFSYVFHKLAKKVQRELE